MTSPAASPLAPLGEGALIVTPTYNERDNLREHIDRTLKVAPGAHILVVDDNSPDGTGVLADQIAKTNPQVKVLHRRAKTGLGTAYVAGFEQGLEADYTHFIEMDADLSHDPRYLADFFDAFAAGADVVVGSRNVPGGSVEGWGPLRHFISKGGSLYSRAVLGVGVKDLTTGYKGYTRRALQVIHLPTVRSSGYSFQVETTYRALNRGLQVVEVPIVFVDRQAGQSKMSQRIFAEALVMVWKLRLGLR